MIPQFLVDEHLARAIQKQSAVRHPGMVVRERENGCEKLL